MHARVAATLFLAVAAAVVILWSEDRAHLGLVIGLLLAGLAFGSRTPGSRSRRDDRGHGGESLTAERPAQVP